MKKRSFYLIPLVLAGIATSFVTGCGTKAETVTENTKPAEIIENTENKAVSTPEVVNIPMIFKIVSKCYGSNSSPEYDKVVEYDNSTDESIYKVDTEYGGFIIYTNDEGSYMNLYLGDEECSFFTEKHKDNPIAIDDVSANINSVTYTIKYGEFASENDDVWIYKGNQPFMNILDLRYLSKDSLDQKNALQHITTQVGISKKNNRPCIIAGYEGNSKRYSSELVSEERLTYNASSFPAQIPSVNKYIFDEIFVRFQYDLANISSYEDLNAFVMDIINNNETLDSHYYNLVMNDSEGTDDNTNDENTEDKQEGEEDESNKGGTNE